ncbi:MAG: dihydrofolate reductase [Chitinophagaceae bacterium]
MMISFVAAASQNNVIGKNNQLPWHLPNDLKFFKNTTWAMPVIMGRKTFESFRKMLTGRTNIVITSNKEWKEEGVTAVSSMDDALKAGAETDAKEVFIIGGGEIFKQTISLADRIYLTRVQTVVEGDVFFPEISEKEWRLVSNRDFDADEKHLYAYSFQLWERKG